MNECFSAAPPSWELSAERERCYFSCGVRGETLTAEGRQPLGLRPRPWPKQQKVKPGTEEVQNVVGPPIWRSRLVQEEGFIYSPWHMLMRGRLSVWQSCPSAAGLGQAEMIWLSWKHVFTDIYMEKTPGCQVWFVICHARWLASVSTWATATTANDQRTKDKTWLFPSWNLLCSKQEGKQWRQVQGLELTESRFVC